MLGKLNHVAIAVKNISSAAKTYKKIFGAQVSEPLDQPIHGVTVVFVTLANTKIELISPLGESSPIMNFFNKNQKINKDKFRSVSDFISGMTDRYAINLYNNLKWTFSTFILTRLKI